MDQLLETIRDNTERAGDLSALIDLLEKATEPSRELDSLIGRSLETAPTEPFKTEAPFDRLAGMYWMLGRKDTSSGPTEERWSKNPPLYTFSIDAALTLIPAGYRWRLGYSRNVPHVAELVDYGQHAVGSFCGECDSNRAIAICIAALKSRSPR